MNHAPPADALRGPTESATMEHDQPAAPDGPRHPRLIMFDVNETLSDMSVLAGRFAELGLSQQLAPTWFAGLLRDGFALTVTGENPDFADVASDSLVSLLQAQGAPEVEAGVERIMGAFMQLPLHPDVVEGVRLLSDSGVRLVTLSNGSTSVAEGLLERNGILDRFERLLSVQAAPAWKPADAAYRYAMDVCGAEGGGEHAGGGPPVGHPRRAPSWSRNGLHQSHRRPLPGVLRPSGHPDGDPCRARPQPGRARPSMIEQVLFTDDCPQHVAVARLRQAVASPASTWWSRRRRSAVRSTRVKPAMRVG